MRQRWLLCSLPIAAALACAAPAAAQEAPPARPWELLLGAGVGSRSNPWGALKQSSLTAVVFNAAIRPAPRHLINAELEVSWWQEETARFGEPPNASSITTHIATAGANLYLQPRVGVLHPRAGVGIFVGRHIDTGTSPRTETALGLNAHAGAELDLSSRVGAFALGRAEQIGTWTCYRAYAGVRLRLAS